MEKINIAKILNSCPKGTKLYSPLCGECEFHRVYHRNGEICIEINTNKEVILCDKYGYYFYGINGEVILFPSKENRDWSTFFIDGNILTTNFGSLFIYNESKNTEVALGCYFGVGCDGVITENTAFAYKSACRLATEEEKEKLFDAIKAKGYRWNAENKILEKLVKPNFKAGDKIEKYGYKYTITEIKDNYYLTKCGNKISIDCQYGFSLVPNKFDITTLKPFDKVLVRDSDKDMWCASIFSHTWKDKFLRTWKDIYFCIDTWYNQCIPYENNEHLLGTTDDCDEYFKTWE